MVYYYDKNYDNFKPQKTLFLKIKEPPYMPWGSWVKVCRILRMTFHRKLASKC